MSHALVVGGGVSGLLASILLKKKFENVTLIEQSGKIGGLLSSFANSEGVTFDYGTHIPKQIGITELDDILFDETIIDESWQRLPVLKVGNYFEGKNYPTSQFLNLRDLPRDLYTRALEEFLSLKPATGSFDNLEDYSQAFYGKNITEHVWRPIMKKLFNKELIDLDQSALILAGYGRLIVADREETIRLKSSSSDIDRKIGFTTWEDGLSSQMNFYPMVDGVEIWPKRLAEKATRLGVDIRLDTKISKISENKGVVNSIFIDNDEAIDVDKVVWTVPANILGKHTNFSFQGEKPEFCQTVLVHFVFDRNFLTNLYFYYCNDKNKKSFRITLYSNLRANKNQPPYNCTIEAFINEEISNLNDLKSSFIQELVDMKIVDERARLIYSKIDLLEYGFPVPSTKFVKNREDSYKAYSDHFKNVEFLGKSSASAFFIHDVLEDTYNKLR